MNKIQLILTLLFISLVTMLPRLWKINAPVADWHSFRQSDTAAVARNFRKLGFDFLRPRYDDFSNIQSGFDNPYGYRMVEFPLYQSLGYGLTQVLPRIPIEVSLRIISILSAVGISIFLFLLIYQKVNFITGLTSALIYAVLPYSIFYGRTILPENLAVFLALLCLFMINLWQAEPQTNKFKSYLYFFISSICGGLAILTKPTSGFLLLPVFMVILSKTVRSKVNILSVILYLFIILFPFWWWRSWINQFPEGIPANLWLLNGDNIRFKGAWFYWLFADRISRLILGYWGVFFLVQGVIVKNVKKEGWYFYWWALGMMLYFIIFARGNVQHDYYQIIILPVISFFVGKGIVSVIENKNYILSLKLLSVFAAAVFMIAFSWYSIRTYYWINRPEIIEVGKLADKILPKEAKVIAPYNGDTTFLYQTNRSGWPIGFDIDTKIAQGATHYVTVSPADSDLETRDLALKYRVIIRNDKYAIFDLTRTK